MSPRTSYACSSNRYDVQSEKLAPSASKSSSSSCWPRGLRHAPRTLTGSLRDQIARRGPASPLCSASSAWYSTVVTQVKKSSRSLIPETHVVDARNPSVWDRFHGVEMPLLLRRLAVVGLLPRSRGRSGSRAYRPLTVVRRSACG